LDERGKSRTAALDMRPVEFRNLGHRLIDQIAEFYESLPERDLTPAKSRLQLLERLGSGGLPEQGCGADDLLREVAPLIFDNSLHNGHPRFLGYISSSAAPLGALADMLASAVNANVAKWDLSPIASEIETQTIGWIAELIGYPVDCGGIMVSGGNSANFHAFVAARQAMASWDIRANGVYGEPRRLTAYGSRETHTWIEKAAEVCGLGAAAVRWIDTDERQRIRLDALRRQIEADRREGCLPFIVVATAGTVSTGAIDPLRDLAEYCNSQGIWLHVDGAYGAPAASLPEAPDDLQALALADSVAIDPHKWLYSPIEAACILTRDPDALGNAFEFRPAYYHFNGDDEPGIDYYQHGLQNSRAFRALKVWLGLRRAGRAGVRVMIRHDIAMARHLYVTVEGDADFEARSLSLSIATFRYVPAGIPTAGEAVCDYLNKLNEAVLAEVQKSGRAFVSNALIDGDYLLRACVVNFRTTESDIDAVLQTIREIGRALDARMRPANLAA
jgi:aromatic-L-amino-acid decarboxylase